MSIKKAAFLDRDDTLIEDVGYLADLGKIKLITSCIPFCSLLQKQGYQLFVVTNQSGIARGYFDEEFVRKTHSYLASIFAEEGVFFAGWYFCPHHPTEGIKKQYVGLCNCRKPKAGLLYQAAKEHGITLEHSLMIGDKELDILAGNTAGCRSYYIQDAIAFGAKTRDELRTFLVDYTQGES